jgi:hypothetical protein
VSGARARSIVVVSGLPRSGTSMMMQMLEAGGLEPLTDGERVADDDNPRGYLELEAVKRTASDPSWLNGAEGRVVKVISALLPTLPGDRAYDVIYMRRSLDAVLVSQRKMLVRRGEPVPDDGVLREQLIAHQAETEAALGVAPFRSLFVAYERAVADPRTSAARVATFLDRGLDTDAMARAVDATLQRSA